MTALIIQINKEILEQKCAVGSENKFLTFKPQLCDKVIFYQVKDALKITTFESQLVTADNAHLSKEIDGQWEILMKVMELSPVYTFNILSNFKSQGPAEAYPYSTGYEPWQWKHDCSSVWVTELWCKFTASLQ